MLPQLAGYFACQGLTLEIVADVMLIVGFRTRRAALALAAFLVPTTVIFHAFWNVEAAKYQTNSPRS